MDVLHMQCTKQLLFYWRCLFSGLDLHARHDWQVMAPNTHRSLFLPLIDLCVLTYICNLKTNGYIWTICISNDCCTIRDIPCLVYSCLRDLTGELQPQTHIGSSLIQHCVIQHCVCMLEGFSYMYVVIWCATMHDNTSHIAYDCTTQQTTALLQVIHCCMRTKLATCN